MFKKITGFVSVSVVLALVSPAPAVAIYNGTDATADKLVSVQYLGSGCSAAPISKRILIVAQHCNGDIGVTKYVMPGESSLSDNTVTVVAKFIPVGQFLGGREYDIMALVVDKDMDVVNGIEIASQEDIDKWRTSGQTITVYGFGLTSDNKKPTNAKKSLFRIQQSPDVGNGISSSYNSYVAMNPVDGVSQVCNGDSGGPSYVFDEDKIYYVGATISTNNMGKCGAAISTSVARLQAIYAFKELLVNAQEWIDTNVARPTALPITETPTMTIPVKEVKKDSLLIKTKKIVCVKQNKKIFITAVNHTCPKGYKKG